MCVVRHLAVFTLQPDLDRQYRYPHYSWHDHLSSGEHLHWLQVTTDTSSHTATSRGCLCTTDALNMSFWNSWIKLLFWSTQKHSNILPTYIWPDVWEVESCDELMVEQKVKTNDIFSPWCHITFGMAIDPKNSHFWIHFFLQNTTAITNGTTTLSC